MIEQIHNLSISFDFNKWLVYIRKQIKKFIITVTIIAVALAVVSYAAYIKFIINSPERLKLVFKFDIICVYLFILLAFIRYLIEYIDIKNCKEVDDEILKSILNGRFDTIAYNCNHTEANIVARSKLYGEPSAFYDRRSDNIQFRFGNERDSMVIHPSQYKLEYIPENEQHRITVDNDCVTLYTH